MVLVGALEGALEGREINTGITKGQGKEGTVVLGSARWLGLR